jgi:glycogen synthase
VGGGAGLWGGGHEVQYWHKWEPAGVDANGNETGVDRVFVDQHCFHRPGMYGEWGKDYGDNLFRFALFAWAGLEAPLCMPPIAPFGEDVVFLANDWQTGLVPLIMTSHYRRYRCFGNARVIFVVHNMGYHGVYPNPPRWEVPKYSFMNLGLRSADTGSVSPRTPLCAAEQLVHSVVPTRAAGTLCGTE